MNLLYHVLVGFLSIIVGVVAFFKWKYSYWRKKGVPYIEPQIPFGNADNPLQRKQHSTFKYQEQYYHFKSLGCDFGGIYLFVRHSLLIVNPELIKNIMAKDFQYFTDRGVYYNEKDDPLSATLFAIEGQKWRHLRIKFTPTFSTGKMKSMFPTLVACGDPMNKAIMEFSEKKHTLDIKDLVARFTTDVIGSCAFGLDCNSFKEPESDFRKYGKLFFAPMSRIRGFSFLLSSAYPELARRLRIPMLETAPAEYFFNTVKETVRYRQQNNVKRNDFMQLLIHLLDEEEKDGEKLTINEAAAQAFIFFLAGFETASTAMTTCLCELSINQDIQDKVRHEINTVLAKYDGNITYDAIMEMKYLGCVIDETLRKYPTLGFLNRLCVEKYQIPKTNVTIEKNTRVIIPVYALHHDPEHFPNPGKFDPDRFNDENKANIHPYTYMPFGEGPRICIGLRFGLLQTKVGLVILLRNFKYLFNPKTRFPLTVEPLTFFLIVKGGIWLDIERIDKEENK